MVQVALALVLLVGAGLLLRSLVQLVTVDRGYEPANVITARIRNPDLRIRPNAGSDASGDRGAGRRLKESLVQEAARLVAFNEVVAVGLSSGLPLTPGLGA